MPNPNPNPNPTPSTTDAATPPRTVAEDKLWAALSAHSAATAPELASEAGIGRSTAAKILARWASAALVTRGAPTESATGGARGRAPERWSLSTPDATPATRADRDEPAIDRRRGESAGTATRADGGTASDGGGDGSTDGEGGAESEGGSRVAENRTLEASGVAGHRAPDAGPRTAIASGRRSAADTVPAAPAAPVRAQRLAPGGLRGIVEDYLHDHPRQAFGPSELGKTLGRSGGAVANALVRLVEAGSTVCTQSKPLRYTLAPAER